MWGKRWEGECNVCISKEEGGGMDGERGGKESKSDLEIKTDLLDSI